MKLSTDVGVLAKQLHNRCEGEAVTAAYMLGIGVEKSRGADVLLHAVLRETEEPSQQELASDYHDR